LPPFFNASGRTGGTLAGGLVARSSAARCAVVWLAGDPFRSLELIEPIAEAMVCCVFPAVSSGMIFFLRFFSLSSCPARARRGYS
jgi:hypothetical protein